MGDTVSERTSTIGSVISRIAELDMDLQNHEFDVLGTAYMILIGLFQSNTGKKGGEFFTPVGPSTLCATLATVGLDEARTVGDCTCGSASMLLDVQKHLITGKVGHFYGKEKSMEKQVMRVKILIVLFSLLAVISYSGEAMAADGNWKQDSTGYWFQYEDGSYAHNEYVDGYWINESGYWESTWDGCWCYNSTGWWFQSGSWYPTDYWLKIDGSWYYFKSDGYMACSEWIGDYYLGENGAWIETAQKDYTNVKSEWELTPGYYTAGIDIPAGMCDVECLESGGFISGGSNSANLVGPEIVEPRNGTSRSFKNFIIEEGDVVRISGIRVSLKYSSITSNYTGRNYNDNSAITLTQGNYVVGKDIAPGRYNIKLISGGGTVTTDQKNEVGEYNSYVPSCNMGTVRKGTYTMFCNAYLQTGDILKLSGIEVMLIPEQ